MTLSAILLSGGQGRRMDSSTPKQYLPLDEKPIILRSLDALLTFSEWKEIVVVCDPKYRSFFSSYEKLPLLFSPPGKTRQDSLFSGVKALSHKPKWICIHDGARPLLKQKDLLEVIRSGKEHGAATLATPVTATIKEANKDLIVKKTLDRSALWNIQTPQVLSLDLLERGKKEILEKNLSITDDVSIAELLNHPVKIVYGSDSNIKITTKTDLLVAKLLLENLND